MACSIALLVRTRAVPERMALVWWLDGCPMSTGACRDRHR